MTSHDREAVSLLHRVMHFVIRGGHLCDEMRGGDDVARRASCTCRKLVRFAVPPGPG